MPDTQQLVPHSHGGKYNHVHAFGEVSHNHMLRAICQRPECQGLPTHNIHNNDEPVPNDYPPLTVEQLIARLKRMDPKAVVFMRVETARSENPGWVQMSEATVRHVSGSAAGARVDLDGRQGA